ncbi:MAG: hypothetical protein HYX43_13690 [Burkholderiales bacterium]|nr:hypothetical protein [Burkholderiales bacterium]
MQSEAERAKLTSILQTALVCVIVEGLLLVLLRLFTGNFLGAAVMSVLLFGPMSAWFAPSLYRHLLKENL